MRPSRSTGSFFRCAFSSQGDCLSRVRGVWRRGFPSLSQRCHHNGTFPTALDSKGSVGAYLAILTVAHAGRLARDAIIPGMSHPIVRAAGVPLVSCNPKPSFWFVANGSTPIRIQRYGSHFAHFSHIPRNRGLAAADRCIGFRSDYSVRCASSAPARGLIHGHWRFR